VTVLGKGDLSRDGFVFNNWNTSQDGSGKTYAPQNMFRIQENVTLYAVWISEGSDPAPDRIYSVVYYSDSETAGSPPSDSNSPYPENFKVTTLAKGSLEKPGYFFNGWRHDDTSIHQPGEQFAIDGNISLYAQWIREKHTVNVSVWPPDSGNVTGSGDYSDGEAVVLQAEPAIDGWNFLYWQEGNYPGAVANPYSFEVKGDRHLTAVFSEVAEIPTLSEWGMIILSALMLLCAASRLYVTRSRRGGMA